MNVNELSEKLREMYRGASQGDAVVMVHLFGIKYANEIRESGASDLPPRFIPPTELVYRCSDPGAEPGGAERSLALHRTRPAPPPAPAAGSPARCAA